MLAGELWDCYQNMIDRSRLLSSKQYAVFRLMSESTTQLNLLLLQGLNYPWLCIELYNLDQK